MSRARHKKHEGHEKHRADGGELKASSGGNPAVLKLAKEGSKHVMHGNESSVHLGAARGGKIKAHKRGRK